MRSEWSVSIVQQDPRGKRQSMFSELTKHRMFSGYHLTMCRIATMRRLCEGEHVNGVRDNRKPKPREAATRSLRSGAPKPTRADSCEPAAPARDPADVLRGRSNPKRGGTRRPSPADLAKPRSAPLLALRAHRIHLMICRIAAMRGLCEAERVNGVRAKPKIETSKSFPQSAFRIAGPRRRNRLRYVIVGPTLR